MLEDSITAALTNRMYSRLLATSTRQSSFSSRMVVLHSTLARYNAILGAKLEQEQCSSEMFYLQGISNDGQKAAVLGAVAGAHHVRLMAEHYGVPVILHSDHCAKKLLPWFDGMLDANEKYFKVCMLQK